MTQVKLCERLEEPHLYRATSPIFVEFSKFFEFSGIFGEWFGIDYNIRRLTLQIQGILVSQ